MKKYLMTFGANWADEMNIDGAMILTEEQKNEFINACDNLSGEFSFCIGTNEEIEFDSESLMNSVDFTEVTEEEEKCIKKFSLDHMGFAPDLYEQLLDNYEFSDGGDDYE